MLTQRNVGGLQPWTKPLRRCQSEPCAKWVAVGNPKDFLLVLTPGAGKTLTSARLAYAVLRQGLVERVVFVCPRTNLKKQVARSFNDVGLHLDYLFDNAAPHIGADMHGVVVTYQQVAANPSVFRDLCRRSRVIAIFDEVHHAGDDATWGDALELAFGDARHRLQLSGTPFRRGASKIAFVTYDNRGACVADYDYPYREALKDDVVRKLVFAVFEGTAEWISGTGESVRADFTAKLSRTQRSERLRTHLLHENNREVLANAHSTLMHIRRNGHPNAGGLLIAMNQEHARMLAGRLREVTGVTPPVVVSEDPSAEAQIEAFAAGSQPWVVAVHMISEGVDIRRLRVGVYFSNVRTANYFAQFCGRFTRNDPRFGGESYVFIPGDADIVAFAQSIVDDIVAAEHDRKRKAVREEDDATEEPVAVVGASEREARESAYAPLLAEPNIARGIHGELLDANAGDVVVFDDEQVAPEHAVVSDGSALLVEQKHALKSDVIRAVARASKEFNIPHSLIHATLKTRCGGQLKTASLAQLQKRKKVVEKWLQQNRYDGFR